MFRLYGKLPDRKDLLDRKLKVMNCYMGSAKKSNSVLLLIESSGIVQLALQPL